MATYDLAYPGAAIDAILNTAYFLQEAGYIFRGSASEYSGTPSKRVWLIAPAGFTGYGISSPVPQGSIGICLYNGTSWVGKIINVATIDSTPTQNSGNAVSSGGAYAAINQLSASVTEALENLTFTDKTPSAFQDEYINMKVSTTEGGVERILTFFTILAATTSKAGLLSAADKAKLDAILGNLRSLSFTDTTPGADAGTKIVETLKMTVDGVQEAVTALTILAATTSKAGLMSATDKAYIDGLPTSLSTISTSISKLLAMLGYYECSTAAATAAKEVSASGYALTNGGCIRIKMTNGNTANGVTLNINGTGAKNLYYDGAQASSSNTWEAGEVLEVYYDGTQYQCASGGGGEFATGQKVKEVSITNDVEGGSDDIPTSGGVWGKLHVQGVTPKSSLYARLGIANNTHYVTTTIRVSVPLKGARLVHILSMTSGYRVAVQQWDASDPSVPLSLITGTEVADSGWLTSATDVAVVNSANYVVVSISKSNDGAITIDEAINNTSFNYDSDLYKWEMDIEELKETEITPRFFHFVKIGKYSLAGQRTGGKGNSNVVQTNFEIGKKYRITITLGSTLSQYCGFYLYESDPSQGSPDGFTLSGINAGESTVTFIYEPALAYNYLRAYSSVAYSANVIVERYEEKTYIDESELSTFINEDDKIPTNESLIKYTEGVKALTPMLAEYQNYSFFGNGTYIAESPIRCLVRLPRNVSRVRITSIANGYRAAFIRFKANDPSADFIDLTGVKISDTGWETAPFEMECYGVNTYVLHFSKSNDANISPSEVYNNVSVEYDYGDVVESYSDGLFDLSNKTFSKVITNTDGLDLNAHKCFRRWEIRASDLSMQNSSPQGSAIYGNYLFVYFYSGTTMRIFDLSSGELLHSYTLSGVGHGNSLQFGEVEQSTGFPYLYISGSVSADSPQNVIYVALVSLSSASVVRTITLDGNALAMQNCAIDFARQKLYALTFNNQYSGDVKIVRYDVTGLESSTAATFTPIYEASKTHDFLGVIQGVTFFNNTFCALISDYDVTFARLYFFNRSLELLDTWQWEMNSDSECQGVTPFAQKDKLVLVVPAWWRYVEGQTYFYRLQYIN